MLKNKTILISGASIGIGAACAKQFAAAGARLILTARRTDRIQELSDSLKAQYGTAILPIVLDVTNHDAVQQIITNLPASWQIIDILLNNAGLAAGLAKLYEADVQDWEAMIDTNVKGLLYMTRYIVPGMVERNQGHVINIGSIAGHQPYANGSV